jgi:hypothetical protein
VHVLDASELSECEKNASTKHILHNTGLRKCRINDKNHDFLHFPFDWPGSFFVQPARDMKIHGSILDLKKSLFSAFTIFPGLAGASDRTRMRAKLW